MFGVRLVSVVSAVCVAVFFQTPAGAQSPTATPSPAASVPAPSSPTPSPPQTPVALDFDPDLDHNGAIDAEDLIRFLEAWQIREYLLPTPTPPYTLVTGFVTSASTNLGVSEAWVLAGTAAVQTQSSGFFRMETVRTDTNKVVVQKDGFLNFETPVDLEIPTTLLQIILLPIGFPTPVPTSTPTPSETRTPTHTPTPTETVVGSLTASPTFTATGTAVFTEPPTETSTSTPTASPTPTFTATPIPSFTPVPFNGIWQGKLNPEGGGEVFNGTDITWTVTSGNQATAEVLGGIFSGTYTFTPPDTLSFQATTPEDSIDLELVWDGDETLSGTFDLAIYSRPPFSQEIGSVVLTRSSQ